VGISEINVIVEVLAGILDTLRVYINIYLLYQLARKTAPPRWGRLKLSVLEVRGRI